MCSQDFVSEKKYINLKYSNTVRGYSWEIWKNSRSSFDTRVSEKLRRKSCFEIIFNSSRNNGCRSPLRNDHQIMYGSLLLALSFVGRQLSSEIILPISMVSGRMLRLIFLRLAARPASSQLQKLSDRMSVVEPWSSCWAIFSSFKLLQIWHRRAWAQKFWSLWALMKLCEVGKTASFLSGVLQLHYIENVSAFGHRNGWVENRCFFFWATCQQMRAHHFSIAHGMQSATIIIWLY